MSTPEQIQRDIEGTRQALSTDVDRLSEKVSPGRVVGRRVDRVKSGARSMREKIMGSVPDPQQVKASAGGAAGAGLSSAKDAAGSGLTSAKDAAGSGLTSAKDAMGSAASTVGDAASTVGDAVTGAPQAMKQQAQGNPLGAGLVAFGVGMIISSLIPPSEREKELATQTQGKAMGPLQEKAKEIGSELQGTVQESAQQVKQTATQAASQTAEQARSAADDVKAPLQQ